TVERCRAAQRAAAKGTGEERRARVRGLEHGKRSTGKRAAGPRRSEPRRKKMVSREQDRSSDSSLGSGPEPRPFVRAIAYFYWSYVVLFITIGLVVAVWVGEGFPLEKRALAKVGLFA